MKIELYMFSFEERKCFGR